MSEGERGFDVIRMNQEGLEGVEWRRAAREKQVYELRVFQIQGYRDRERERRKQGTYRLDSLGSC